MAGSTGGALPGQTAIGQVDAYVRKYDQFGGEVWTQQFGTPLIDEAQGIAVGPDGVYVAGTAQGALPGQTLGGADDPFARKYDTQGNEVWTNQFGTIWTEYTYAVAAGGGAVYVAGLTWGLFPGQTYQGGSDAFVAALETQPPITRSMGFWATHFDFTRTAWARLGNATIGGKVVDDDGKLFGAFWSSIAKKTNGETRSPIDRARMQLLQQLVAAILNRAAFDADDKGLIALGLAAFSGTDRVAVVRLVDALRTFNESGSERPLSSNLTPGRADPRRAQATANRFFWDTLP